MEGRGKEQLTFAMNSGHGLCALIYNYHMNVLLKRGMYRLLDYYVIISLFIFDSTHFVMVCLTMTREV